MSTADPKQTVCPLCDRQGELPMLYPSKAIVRCPSCGLVFYGREVATGELYGQDYYSGAEYRDYLADERAHRGNFRRRLADLVRLKPAGRLFEIGCAYGLFLDEARKAYDVRGIDIAPEATAYAREKLHLPVAQGDFLDQPDEADAYDVVCLWDTIEHLARPMEYIRKAARWLRPGGILAITTGDVDSLVARWRGQKWRLIHPPTHLFYFSQATLDHAAASFGLRPLEARHVGYSRSWKSMAFGMFQAGRKGRSPLYRLATLGDRLDFSVYLNFHDIVMHVSQKP